MVQTTTTTTTTAVVVVTTSGVPYNAQTVQTNSLFNLIEIQIELPRVPKPWPTNLTAATCTNLTQFVWSGEF